MPSFTVAVAVVVEAPSAGMWVLLNTSVILFAAPAVSVKVWVALLAAAASLALMCCVPAVVDAVIVET